MSKDYIDPYNPAPNKPNFGGQSRDNFLAFAIKKEEERATLVEASLDERITHIEEGTVGYITVEENPENNFVTITLLDVHENPIDSATIEHLPGKLIRSAELITSANSLDLICQDGERISCNFESIFSRIASLETRKEDVSNKVTSLSDRSTNIQYPSAKAVYDYVATSSSKIDSISIDGVAQPIDNKNVDLPAYPTRTSLNIDNVDNTSDLNKPISTATQVALDLKAADNAVVHLDNDETIIGIKHVKVGNSQLENVALYIADTILEKPVKIKVGGGNTLNMDAESDYTNFWKTTTFLGQTKIDINDSGNPNFLATADYNEAYKGTTFKSYVNVDGLLFTGGQELRFGGNYLNVTDNTNEHNTILQINKDYINAEKVVTAKQGLNIDVQPTEAQHAVRKDYVDNNFVKFNTEIQNGKIIFKSTSGMPGIQLNIDNTKYLTFNGQHTQLWQQGTIGYDLVNNISLYPTYTYVSQDIRLDNMGTNAKSVTTKEYVDNKTSGIIEKEDKSNKVALDSSNTTDQYPNAKSVWDECQNIRKVAEGKCKTYILSYAETVASVKAKLQGTHVPPYKAYKVNANVRNAERVEITNDIINGDYDDAVVYNGNFNSQSSEIILSAPAYPNHKYLIVEYGLYSYLFIDYHPTQNNDGFFGAGDIILVKEVDVPDRWVSSNTNYSFNKLETSKIDLSGYPTKAGNETITGQWTFNTDCLRVNDIKSSGGILMMQQRASNQNGFIFNGTIEPYRTNTYDIGTSSKTVRDLYLSRNLTDGTNSITVANIAEKLDKITSTSSADRAYVVKADGSQTVYNISTAAVADTLVKRTSTGNIKTTAPTSDDDATTKKYVDDSIASVEIASGTILSLSAATLEAYKLIIMTGYKSGVTQPNATTVVFTPAGLGTSFDSGEVFRCVARNNPADWEYNLRVWKDTNSGEIKWQSDIDYGSDWNWYATKILGVK